MNRLKILVLHKSGTFNEFIDIQSMLGYLHRCGHLNNFQVVATKGRRAIFFEKIDVVDLIKDIGEFQIQP